MLEILPFQAKLKLVMKRRNAVHKASNLFLPVSERFSSGIFADCK